MHSLTDQIQLLSSTYTILGTVNCDYDDVEWAKVDLYDQLKSLHKTSYENDERIIITITKDFYAPRQSEGSLLQLIQVILQEIDISNYFVCLLSTNSNIVEEYEAVHAKISIDPVPVNIFCCQGLFEKNYLSGATFIGKMQTANHQSLNMADKKKLFENKVFCIMPWVGMYIRPDNRVAPCCEFDKNQFLGRLDQHPLPDIWNSDQWKKLRNDLFNNRAPDACNACYHKESLGRDSLRNSINRDFAHKIDFVNRSAAAEFTMPLHLGYFDIRYSNLCNLTCRSCNPVLSSSWAQIHGAIFGSETKALLKIENTTGDIRDQIKSMLPQIEKIYFAGGEPTMIDDCYEILMDLDRLNRNDVHLVFNTNLTRLGLKHWDLLDLWQKFSKVTILASLDGMEQRGEYLRSGSKWQTIEANARKIKTNCPHVDFYVSCTTGLINALHVPDFHQTWVAKGLINPQDFNLQILYGPEWMSLKNSPNKLKQKVVDRYLRHLEWLRPVDQLGRATSGFESVISFAQESGAYDKQKFWANVSRLDTFFNSDLFNCFPELRDLDL
jgi:radical SAM protein with 4Fe4S-binding SPASM domain